MTVYLRGVEPDAEAWLHQSIHGLREQAPELSAGPTLSGGQRILLLLLGSLSLGGILVNPMATISVLVAMATAIYIATIFYRVRIFSLGLTTNAILHVSDEHARAIPDSELPAYTVLIPAYREPEVMSDLLSVVGALEYPEERLDIRLLLEADDEATIRAARAVGAPNVEIVTVPPFEPRTKPKACNFGLLRARGQFITIYDAEDRPDPLQLRRAVAAFRRVDPKVVCLQARLLYHNSDQNLLTRWFANEYALWFTMILPGLAAARAPLPLGGTSNHFRRDVLEEIGAWDPFNVTEDADLGMRLYRQGYGSAVLDSVTYEEANSDFTNWIRQRSRWYKGYLQTWLVHTRNPVRLWRELGFRGFVSFHLVIGGTPILAIINPIFWILTILWFLGQPNFIREVFPPFAYYGSAASMLFGNFVTVYMNVVAARAAGQSHLLPAVLLCPLYWAMMAIAAWKAAAQLAWAPAFWEKTVHGLSAQPAADLSPPEPIPLRLLADPRESREGETPPQEVEGQHSDSEDPGPLRERRRSDLVLFMSAIGVYGTVALCLLYADLSLIDAVSRVANGSYAIFGRDPHLTAIGFVWTPLQSLLAIPLLPFREIWPALGERGFAANVISTTFMAAAVVQVARFARETTESRWWRALLPIAFGLHPVIVFYAANGMSEAAFLFFLVWTSRSLASWVRTDDPGALMRAGAGLALAYLTRYEAVAAAMGATLLVVFVSARRNRDNEARRSVVVADALILAMPFAAAFTLWALASWLFVGYFFAQFSSSYGTSAALANIDIETAFGVDPKFLPMLLLALQLTFVLQPLLPIIIAAGTSRTFKRTDFSLLAPLFVLGASLAFALLAFATGRLAPFVRYFISTIPLGIMYLAPITPQSGRNAFIRSRRLVTLSATALIGLTWISGGWAMGEFVTSRRGGEPMRSDTIHRFHTERNVARYLDTLSLPSGSVLVDVRYAFPIVLASRHPSQFVIPSDRDFAVKLARPFQTGVRYLLTIPNQGHYKLDLLNRLFPRLYASGGRFSTLVLEAQNEDPRYPSWRLYRLLPPGEPRPK